jgi:hypothetical protein
MGNSTGRRVVWVLPPPQPQASEASSSSSSISMCSEDVSACAWEDRHLRARDAPYVTTALCRTHRYSLATALVHLLLSGSVDGLQVTSDAQALVLVRSSSSGGVMACRLLNACGEPHLHARFGFDGAAMQQPPLDGAAAARLLFTSLTPPSTWVLALSQHQDDADAAARMQPLGKWLAPPASPAASDAARIVRSGVTEGYVAEDAPRALEWRFTDQLRRDFCAQPMSVLFQQTTFPDPTLPHSGLCSLWSYLTGARGGRLYTRAVALTPPSQP